MMQKGRVQKVVLCCFLINIVIHLCTPVSGSGDRNKGNQSLWFYSCPWKDTDLKAVCVIDVQVCDSDSGL